MEIDKVSNPDNTEKNFKIKSEVEMDAILSYWLSGHIDKPQQAIYDAAIKRAAENDISSRKLVDLAIDYLEIIEDGMLTFIF